MANPVRECPLKPVPEKSQIVANLRTSLGDAPANACTQAKCMWWLAMRAEDGSVAGNCVLPIATVALLNIESGLRAGLTAVLPAPPTNAPPTVVS